MKKLLIALATATTLTLACRPLPYVPVSAEAVSQVAEVNNIQYRSGNAEPAVRAFRIVAGHRGWSDEKIADWEPFVIDIVLKESSACPGVRGGGRVDADCNITKQGKRSDSGFGQVLMGYPHRRGWKYGGTSWRLNEHASWLCAQEGLCTPNEVISSPWNSMTALVALVERAGSQPWCYNSYARSVHRCKLAPRR